MTSMEQTRDIDAQVAQQLTVFKRGIADLIDEKQLAGMLRKSLTSSTPLRIKFGMDPSSADLHIGHAVQLFKLRDLQELGHTIVLIVGDSTAMVGDPSGRNKLRPVLTKEEVEANLVTYTDQAGKVLDMSRTEVRRNSEWFEAMGFADLLKLTTRMTVAQMIERDTFQTRMQANEPIGINEFLYPLMQGWDSVQIKCDMELGGTDQLFNLLVGRRLQEQEEQRPQVCFTMPLINGLDGRKMSKSYGNAIGLLDSARDMYFAVMRLDDEAMATWFTLLTRVPEAEMTQLLAGHPREAKARLAFEITTFFHSADDAHAAAEAFDREVRKKELPSDLKECPWSDDWGTELPLANLLKEMGLVTSSSEARRAAQQGGVKLDGEVNKDATGPIARPTAPIVVQVGKKRVARLMP